MPENVIEDVKLDEPFADITPLESVVGFKIAEVTYDSLNFRDQLIIDLLCAGWNQADIGLLFGVSQPGIAGCIRRIRFKLAQSTLKISLELRQNYREESRSARGKKAPSYIPSND